MAITEFKVMHFRNLIREMNEANRTKGTVPISIGEALGREAWLLFRVAEGAFKGDLNNLEDSYKSEERYAFMRQHEASKEQAVERTDEIAWLTERNERARLINIREEYPAIEAPCNGKVTQLKKSSRKNARVVQATRADKSTDS